MFNLIFKVMCKKHVLLLLLFALFAPWAAQAQTRETLTFDFEDGQLPSEWSNNSTYPWLVVSESQNNGHAGTYCIKSGNSGVSSSTSTISATFIFVGDGSISFLGGCWGEGSSTAWDKCIFSIDGVQEFAYGARDTWETYSFNVEAGEHTFTWSFSKDSSVNGTGDAFFVDNIVVDLGIVASCPKPTALAATLTMGDGSVATLGWTENGEATNWVLQIATDVEFTMGLEEYSVSAGPSKDLTGLTAETTYYARVKASCSASDQSDWSSMISFTPSNAFSITVNEGTSTNSYVPFYGYYADNNSDSQFIIPAADLTDLQWGTINKLTFYSSTASASWSGAVYDVYFKEVSNTEFETNSFIDWTSMTKAYTGSVSIVDNMMELTLSTPYQYLGGNLMIGFDETTNSSDYPQAPWYGVTQTNNTAIFQYSTNAATLAKFLPKVTLNFEPGEAPTCFKPINLAASLTEGEGTIATLTWTEVSGAANWVLQYGTDATFAAGSYSEVTEGFTVVADTAVTANLTGLTAETVYYVRVKSVCSDTDQSDWSSTINFKPSNYFNITVNDGTTTNTYIPIYYYVSYYQGRSQFIIPSANLTSLKWGEIGGLTFYNNVSSAEYGNATFKVYVAEVDYTTMTSFADWASLTEVYSGTLTISENKMEVAFDEPFLYNDGNLLIGFYQNGSGTNPSSNSWYGVNGVSGNSRYYTYSEYSSNFLPKTTFAYTPNLNPVLYDITVAANPEAGGTVTDSFTALAGRTYTITAVANYGYEFTNWTKNGEIVAVVDTLSFTATEDAEYVANFRQLPTYTVTVTTNLENGGDYGVDAQDNIFLEGETCIIYAYPYDGFNFLGWTNAAGETVSVENEIMFVVSQDTAFVANFEIYPFNLTSTPDTLNIGERPSGAWMRPFAFSLTNTGGPQEVQSITFDNEFFGVDLGVLSLPFVLGYNQTVDLGMTWGSGTGAINGHLIVTYGDDNATKQLDVAGTAYVPVQGDVWENPFVVGSFPYTQTVDATTMHDNYVMPFADVEDGNDVVYQLDIEQDIMLSASVTEGENGKVALYEEGFQGIGGPDQANVFVGTRSNGGNRDAVELTVHDGSTTNNYVPVYGNYADAYLKCEFIYPAEELVDMAGGEISNLKFYSSTANASWTSNFQVFMKEVDQSTLTAFTGMDGATIVYEGTLAIVSNEMTLELATPYVYNGGNLLVGFYNTIPGNYISCSWRGETVSGASVQGYNYSSLESISATGRNFLPKTTFIYESGPTVGPEIEDMALVPGTYYLVASSTSDEFKVEMTTAPMPCPDTAYNPTPADGAIGISDVAAVLSWKLGENTTSYSLLFGTDPTNLETLVDWTRELQTQYAFEDTLNLHTTYFWQVAEKNDGCPDGVYSDIWSFTTTFNGPTHLATSTGKTDFLEGEPVQLVWDAPIEHRLEMAYIIYQDNDSVGYTTDTTFSVNGLALGSATTFYVAARYTLDGDEYESNSNEITVYVVTMGMVEGYVYESDGQQVIPDATVNLYGIDLYGFSRDYEFITDENGHYSGEMVSGFYTGNYAMAQNYESNSTSNTSELVLGNYDFENQALIVGAESSPNYPWVITSADNHTEGGQYALRSNNKNVNGSVSYIGMYVTYAADDTLSFACRISSEQGYDKGYFSIDDAIQSNVNGISGNGSWLTCSYPMTAGNHVIIWYYQKDSSTSSYDDCFYIDDIDFGTGTVEGILIESETTTSGIDFYLNDVLYMVDDLYVSRTGYAMWEGLGESEGGTRHFNDAEIYLTALVNDSITDTIFMGRTPNTYYQLPVEVMENGNTYWCHVKQSFTSGESDVYTTEFVYESCDNFEVATDLEGVLDATGVTLTWVYPTADSTAIATPMGAFLFRDGEWLDLATTDNYLDPDGLINSVYEMRVVYDGEAVCPVSNYYYAMSCFDTIPVRYAQYEISATVEPVEAGVVTGAGLLNYNSNAELTAVANTGYTFDHWTKDGVELEAGESFGFTVTQPASFVAHFTLNSYNIAAIANPEAGGNVEGAGTYNHFETCTLVATPEEGYHFVNWTLNGEEVGAADTLSFEVSGPATYVANFELNSYEITAVANPEDGGTIEGAGTYNHFDVVTLTATAATGYTFLNWTKDGVAFADTETVTDTVTGPATYVANFELNSYEITAVADPEEGGEVEGAGTYNHFDEVILTATAAEGYTFINWTKDGVAFAETETITDTVTGPAAYVANFELNSYEITAVANPEEGGTIDGAGTYNHFDVVTLTATAATGYTFINWTKDGVVFAETETITDTVTAPAAYVANFELNSYEITAVANPEEGGTIEGAGIYNHFDVVTLTATAAEGFHFMLWTKNGQTFAEVETITDTVTGPAAYVAIFELNAYDITATANPEEGGTIEGAGTYNHFEEATLTATAAEGYTFLNWSLDGETVAETETYSFTVTGEAAYVANFELNSYEIAVTANPTDGGTVTGAGTYDYGTEATLTATAAEGYTFLNWTLDGETVAEAETYSFTVTGEAEYVANFELNSYEIVVSVDPEEGGNITGATTGTYNHFEEITLSAQGAEGYTFINWTKNGTQVSTSIEFTTSVTGEAEYVAHFSHNAYVVTVDVNIEEAGVVSGTGGYDHGDIATLTATANEGYTFVNWTMNGVEVSTENPFQLTVTETATYIANFELNSYEITAVASPENGGTVTGTGMYDFGTEATLTATAAEGYTFLNWTLNGQTVAETATYSFTVTGEAEYVANFELNSYEITAVANPENGGTVEGAGTYNHFDVVTLTATAATGYTFLNWTKDGVMVAETEIYTDTVTGPAAYVANFELNSYEITVVANPEAGGTVEGAGTYNHFDIVTLTATTAEGYTFLNWTKDGVMVAETEIYSDTVTGPAAYVANFELNSYEITAVASPEEGGTITGAGMYDYGTEATLTATAAEGYTFLNWVLDGEPVAETATYSFTVTGEAEYVANFELNSYEITAVANPEEGGTITGAGMYDYGTEATLTATAAEGYTFLNWTLNGQTVAETATYSFTVTGEAEYVANFELNSYEITAVASPEEGGTITGAGTYDYGTEATLTATAAEGYTFMNWTMDGQVVAETATYSFTVTGEAEYVANFEQIILTVVAVAEPAEGGTVTGAGEYVYGSEVTLTATAAEGYTFLNWMLNGQTVVETATYTFQVTEDANFVANFELNSYEITAVANPEDGGTITGAGTYDYGTEATLTATAAEGYHFLNWTLNGQTVAETETYSFTVTGEAAYVANFELNSYEITAVANPEDGGTVEGANTYNHGDIATLTATANEGYTFLNWTHDGETVAETETYSFTVTGEAEYVANFELNSYEITVVANPEEGGIVDGTGTYNHFEEVTLTATANEGYTFLNWTLNGQTVAETATYSFTVTGEAAYVANFELNSYEITVAANPTEGGTVSGAGTYNHFETATLTATANEGYHFVNWMLNGQTVAETETYSFTVTGEAEYVANFELNSYEITATANPTAGGTITGAGTYNHFDVVTLTATAATGYTFLNWTKDGETVGTNESLTITVTEAAAYVANFELNSYEITVAANPTEGGTVSGAGTYNHFETATLTATANEGYHFLNWTLNGQTVSNNATYEFTVTDGGEYVANFELNSYDITVAASPTEGGTVSGAGTYNHFETATLTATPNSGYDFVNWTLDGQVVSTSDTFMFQVTEAAAYVANFELSSFEITVVAEPEEGGVVTGAGTYTYMNTCMLTATANEGYTFLNWMLDGQVISEMTTFIFQVTEEANYVANFELNSYEITAVANPEDGGTVTGAGTYGYGTEATLTATAAEGYTFLNWMLNGQTVAETETYSFTVTDEAEYVANFELNSYEITAVANPEVGGTIEGAGTYNHFDEVTLVATPAENYNFLNWTLDGVIVAEGNELTFTVTGPANYVANFELANITQVTDLAAGWNWWSGYVELGEDGLTMLENSLGTNGLVIKSQSTGFVNYNSAIGWYGSLATVGISNDLSYQISMSQAMTAELSGIAANPANHPITLYNGWTWIGYPSTNSMAVSAAFSGANPQTGDMVKSQNNGFASYLEGYGWYGALNTIEPGMGLMFKSTNTQAVTFTYGAERGELMANQKADNNHWVPNLHAYPDNMNVMAVIELNDEELRGESFELAAFANGECRGSARLLYVAPIDRYIAFLTVAGESEAELYFGLYDTETGLELLDAAETLTFTVNAVVGSFEEPYVVHFRNTTGIDEDILSLQVYPNPIESGRNFSIGSLSDNHGTIRVEVVNALGAVVAVEETTEFPSTFKAPATPGVYTLRITVDGKGTVCLKLVVR